mgnify:CR=1 FL=1
MTLLADRIAAAVPEKVRDSSTTTMVVQIEGYGIGLTASNWIVGKIAKSTNPIEALGEKMFDSGTNSYHICLSHALQALSKRLMADKLKVACKDRPLELKELAKLIKSHHEWFVGLVEGI